MDNFWLTFNVINDLFILTLQKIHVTLYERRAFDSCFLVSKYSFGFPVEYILDFYASCKLTEVTNSD